MVVRRSRSGSAFLDPMARHVGHALRPPTQLEDFSYYRNCSDRCHGLCECCWRKPEGTIGKIPFSLGLQGLSDAPSACQVWSRIWWFFDVLFLAAAVFSAILLVSAVCLRWPRCLEADRVRVPTVTVQRHPSGADQARSQFLANIGARASLLARSTGALRSIHAEEHAVRWAPLSCAARRY